MTDEEKAVRKQFRLLYDDYWDEKSKNRKSLFDLLLGFTLQVHREARQEGREEGYNACMTERPSNMKGRKG